MKIGINLRYLQKKTTGIERALFEEIIALDKLEGDHTLIGYITGRTFADADIEKSLEKCTKLIIMKSKLLHEDLISRLFWENYHLGQMASNDKIDVFWGPAFSIPMSINCPSIVTIHDLAHEYFPNAYTPVVRLWLRTFSKIAAQKSTRILTISENSKKDIIKFYKVDSDRIDVVPLACNSNFRFMPENVEQFKKTIKKYYINSPFILTVSLISPRKNLEVLIKAFGLLKKNPRFLHKLVIVGNNGWLHKNVYETVKYEGLANEVIFTGGIPDKELIAFYNLADLFAFPSLYEGFGLPVLEAMSCGAPVICSNTSSLPEVAGNAGMLIPPNDINSLSSAIAGLLEDSNLRKGMRDRGLQRASEFSWESSAKQLLQIFQRIC